MPLTIRDIKDALEDLKAIRQQAVADRAWTTVREVIARSRQFQAELTRLQEAKA